MGMNNTSLFLKILKVMLADEVLELRREVDEMTEQLQELKKHQMELEQESFVEKAWRHATLKNIATVAVVSALAGAGLFMFFTSDSTHNTSILSSQMLQESAILLKNITVKQIDHNIELGQQIENLVKQLSQAQEKLDKMEGIKLETVFKKLNQICHLVLEGKKSSQAAVAPEKTSDLPKEGDDVMRIDDVD